MEDEANEEQNANVPPETTNANPAAPVQMQQQNPPEDTKMNEN